jgi:hypothetical protein
MIDTLTERHFLPMMTPAAFLTGVGGVYFDKRPASFFRFARKFVEKPCPRGIMNAFRKTMIVGHPIDVQVFHTDDGKAIDNATAFLVREVVTSEGDPLMHPGDGFSVLTAFRCAFGQLGMRALDVCQRLLFRAEKPGVLNCCTRRQGRKRLESDINPDVRLHWLKALGFTLTGEGYVPLASPTTPNGTGFQLALERTVSDHLHPANLGKRHVVIMGETEPALGEGETIIAVCATETGKPWLLSCLTASEKGFEGQINPHGDILQDLRMDPFKRGALVFQQGIGGLLFIARQTLALVLIGVFALLQQVVIDPTTFIKGVVERVKLFLGRIESVLKHFKHVHMLRFIRTTVKGARGTHPITPQKERPCIPRLKDGGFLAREL